MELSALGVEIRRRIEPEMRSRGFGRGGPGWSPDGSHAFLWCVGADDFEQRWPATAAALRVHIDPTPHPAACIDLTLGLTADGSIERFDLEFVAADVLLGQLGLDELAARSRLLGGVGPDAPDETVDEILAVIRSLLPA